MKLSVFDALIGQDSYVRCSGKKRIDSAIVDKRRAEEHLFSGGQIGWWVRTGYIIVDIDEGKSQALKIVKELGLKTLMAQTPKGLHLYFKCDQEFPQRVGMILPCGLKCDFAVRIKAMYFFHLDRRTESSTAVVRLLNCRWNGHLWQTEKIAC